MDVIEILGKYRVQYLSISSLSAAILASAFFFAAPASAGAPPDEVSPYEKKKKVKYRRRAYHSHRPYNYPPTVMKDGRAYFYYPGTGDRDQPAYSHSEPERYVYDRPYRFRLFDRRLRW